MKGDDFTERETFDKMPEVCIGGFLEWHEGEECLRVADAFNTIDGKIVVERTWRRPKLRPFDSDYYIQG